MGEGLAKTLQPTNDRMWELMNGEDSGSLLGVASLSENLSHFHGGVLME